MSEELLSLSREAVRKYDQELLLRAAARYGNVVQRPDHPKVPPLKPPSLYQKVFRWLHYKREDVKSWLLHKLGGCDYCGCHDDWGD